MIKIIGFLFVAVLIALLFNQLPQYIIGDYVDYIFLVPFTVFAVLLIAVIKSK